MLVWAFAGVAPVHVTALVSLLFHWSPKWCICIIRARVVIKLLFLLFVLLLAPLEDQEYIRAATSPSTLNRITINKEDNENANTLMVP